MTSPSTPGSHTTELGWRSLARVAGPSLVAAWALGMVLHLLGWAGALPDPAPADLDHAILATKARLAREGPDATVVLLGDSSCLMNVDAPLLGRRLEASVLNLGTLSYLGLADHAALLETYEQRHPGVVTRVVLLLNPESLRRSEPVPEYSADLRSRLRTGAKMTAGVGTDPWGTGRLREQVLDALAPPPLSGEFGPRYGTPRHAARVLERQRGSLVDPTRFLRERERGSGEFRWGAALEPGSRAFGGRRPRQVPLWVGLTPVPDTVAAAGHEARAGAWLETWAGWLGTDRVLRELPAAWPEDRFATRTHLNEAGVAEYTERLARALGAAPAPVTPH